VIRLRHLRLRSFTADQSFQADIPFDAGLNIIQAPNTSGKSTCLQAVIYVLGLERSLGPQLAIPLPYAMRERIHVAENTRYKMVLQSFVELQLENDRGEIIVLHRDVVGGKDTKLIQATFGPSLTEGAARTRQRDFYVLMADRRFRRMGSTSSSRRFWVGTCQSWRASTVLNVHYISKPSSRCYSSSRSEVGPQSKDHSRPSSVFKMSRAE